MASTTAKDVTVYDRRSGDNPALSLNLTDAKSFGEFKSKICKVFKIPSSERFVICTTNREAIVDDETYNDVDDGETLYILVDLKQELLAPTQQRVQYLPHYDTLIKSGMYEYYASEGQNPLPYALAELIDNSLAATALNSGPRNIEVRLMLEDTDKSTFLVLDNGQGMTSRQLNNWAIYRLSKFSRKEKLTASEDSDDESVSSVEYSRRQMPRSLNSDISYFGVGGKQAIFFMGNSTRMITKTKDSCDVHELALSKDEFERKEKYRESIYSGYIHNRQPGDNSHVPAEDEHVRKFIAEEPTKTNFTCVVVQGISQEQILYAKQNFKNICKQIAHIYHYYIHGAHGNQVEKGSFRISSPFSNINIEIKLCVKNLSTKTINLRDIDDDLQSQYIRTAMNTFEFKAVVEGTGVVEGLLRYHPFLYDRETYPLENGDLRTLDSEDDDYAADARPARGRRPIFECYWNGRLIPYTMIDEFDWCSTPKKCKTIPLDCYNRVSGVLWTNDKFQVSTNKLTFMDLEVRLRDKNTIFCKVVNGQEKRGIIDKQFADWLKECHETCDKQVKFCNIHGIILRSDLPRNRQHPWTTFHSIEWDGKRYKKGQLVRIQRTLPIMFGTIKRFFLFGDYEGDVFATGGEIELAQEPRSLYNEIKVMPLAKLDRSATEAQIRKALEEEEGKLPEKLIVTWPEGDELTHNEKRPAGKTIGAIKIEIANRRGELISKLPGSNQKKLLIELKVVWHSPSGDQTIVNHICQHAKNWPYWFRKMENIKNLGSHTLSLQTVINESDASVYAGKELPSHKIKFTVIEAGPERFTVGLLDGPFRMGIPFQIPLEFQDKFGNPTKPSSNIKPALSASGLELKYDTVQVKGNSLLIKGIIADGVVETNAGKNFNLVIAISGMDDQSLKIRLLPGPPSQLIIEPDDDIIEIENGDSVSFRVQIKDVSGNCTAESKLIAICTFVGDKDCLLPIYAADCSTSGQATLTGDALCLKSTKTTQTVKATIKIQNRPNITPVLKTVKILPSSRASNLTLSYKNESGERITIERNRDITCVAGTVMQDIEFSVLDEGGRELELSPVQLNKVKVNWIPNLQKASLANRLLPNIKIPLSVKESKYCNVGIGEDVDFGFTIKVKAGEPASIKCTCSGENKIRQGELLQSDILVAVSDKHGNNIKKLPLSTLADLEIVGDNLITDHLVRALGQSGGFVIKGVSFEAVDIGPHELCIRWRELSDYVRLQVVAGAPATISIPGFDVDEPITVYNSTTFPHPLIVQLCDEAGNPCEEANIKVQLGVDEGLKLAPLPSTMKTDGQGRVNFGKFTIAVRSNHVHKSCPGELCEQNCKGIFTICPKASSGRHVITGPSIKIHVPSDPTKAVELKVDYDKDTKYTVGETLTEFRVQVIAEDGSVLDSVKHNEIQMKMWKAEGLQNKPPQQATTYSPSLRIKCDEVGLFTFKDRPIPEVAGTHNIVFIYNSKAVNLYSNLIAINVSPGRPVRLVSVQSTATPTVSNTSKLISRTLFKNLKLELRDACDNPAGFTCNGKLSIRIKSELNISEIPLLCGGDLIVEVPFKKGQAQIQNLAIEEDTPGIDGQEYVLQFTAQIPDLPRNHSIPPLEISFLFYNDVKKQAAMADLSKQRDALINSIKTYKMSFESSRQLVSELKASAEAASHDENKVKAELRKHNILPSQLNTLESVEKLIKSCTEEKERIYSAPRRQPGLAPAPRDPDVLGKIAHLSQLEGNDIAQVLSWHMSADMDCIVTHTLAKAKEIYYKTKGSQQVLALDSLYKRTLPDWSKPLPHCKVKSNFQPTGNPVYARELFVFPHDSEQCKMVFGMLLGDAIIFDNLDDATKYRQEIVKYTYCPTLLTRQGDRIRSNGKFGGHQNKAPPFEKLRGAVFGEPLPNTYHKLTAAIELLQSYQAAFMRRQQAEKEWKNEREAQQSSETEEKLRKCQEAEEQLKVVEEQLGMSSSKVQRSTRTRSLVAKGVLGTPKRLCIDLPCAQDDDLNSSADVIEGMSTRTRNLGTLNYASPRLRRSAESPGRIDDRKRRRM